MKHTVRGTAISPTTCSFFVSTSVQPKERFLVSACQHPGEPILNFTYLKQRLLQSRSIDRKFATNLFEWSSVLDRIGRSL